MTGSFFKPSPPVIIAAIIGVVFGFTASSMLNLTGQALQPDLLVEHRNDAWEETTTLHTKTDDDDGDGNDDVSSVFISFIIPCRVDDYGGVEQRAHLKRAVTSLASQLVTQYRTHKKASEIILVEWSPLEGYPSLREFFSDDFDFLDDDNHVVPKRKKNHVRSLSSSTGIRKDRALLSRVVLRIITIPPNDTGVKTGFFMEYWAKNVAARRARGQWFLTTNQDNLFGGKLLDVIFQNKLDERTYYRAGFQVLHEDVVEDIPLSNRDKLAARISDMRPHPTDAYETRRFPRDDPCNITCTPEGTFIESPSFIFDPKKTWKRWKECRKLMVVQSGDFMLMSKMAYTMVGGHLETEGNDHVDSDMVYRMRSAGFNHGALSESCGGIYHQWHRHARAGRPAGANWMTANNTMHCVEEKFLSLKSKPSMKELEKVWDKCDMPKIKKDFGMPDKVFHEDVAILT